MTRNWTLVLAALVVTVAVLSPGASVVGTPHPAAQSDHQLAPATHGGPTASKGVVGSAVPARLQRVAEIERTLQQDHVPSQYIHLPNILGADPRRTGVVAPTYDLAPAPMGVADLGLENVSGTTVPYVLNTSSVEGVASFTTAEAAYLDGDGPDTFGVQMNAVATNVTLWGVPTYEFWAQNYLSYTVGTHTLSFGDNVWNLSDAVGNISSNVFFSHGPNGTLVAPVYYYAVGPTFTVRFPFSVTFFLNATTVGNRPAIFFNYSLTSPTVNASGSFDDVVFNSAVVPPIVPAAVPAFQANGTGVDPYGLPNDLELVLVGNGNGDTTTFFALHATFTLSTWSNVLHAFTPVPSAVDFGSDTGETSNGVSVGYATGLTSVPIASATLTIGPSFLFGLWNDSGTPGYRLISVHQTPVNAFLFVNPGTTYNASEAQWVPTIPFGTATRSNFTLPAEGAYFLEWMLSDYAVRGLSYDGAPNSTMRITVTLTFSAGTGVYTPLLAWGNGELHYIASGNGSATNPYVLHRNQLGQIDPVFGTFNDFFFPVFPGILLINTTAFVHVDPPTLSITYAPDVATNLSGANLPTTNNLQIQLWNVTNATIENAPVITGWLSADVGYSAAGEVTLWGSSGDLIAGNTFYDQGIALALYGGNDNTVWGNAFLNSTAAATNTTAIENGGNNTTGVFEAESGDLVYNNYFALPAPAYTATTDPFSCQNQCLPATYTDRWNVSYAPANTVRTVLGKNLSGSIIGTTYQGGNYWSNYGTPSNPLGHLPYDDSGRIAVGGDYVPLVRSAVFPVSVHEVGLQPGTVWGVFALGVSSQTNGTDLTLYAPNGTFPYTVSVPTGYSGPTAGNFTVNGAGIEVTISFVPLVPVEFVGTGLLASWPWNVTLNATAPYYNVTENTSADSLEFNVAPGNYTFTVAAYGYNATPANGTLVVNGTSLAPVIITFSLTGVLQVNVTGLAPGVPWTLSINSSSGIENFTSLGNNLTLTVFDVPTGNFSWNVSAPGYTATPGGGNGSSPNATNVSVVFAPIAGALTVTINVLTAELWVNGTYEASPGGSFTAPELAGVYAIVVLAPGYVTYYNNVTVTPGNTTLLNVNLTAVPTAAATGPLGISTLGWILIAALAALLALALVAALYFRRRRPPPPAPVAPYAAAGTPSPGRIPAPWEEGPSDRATEPPAAGGARPPT